MYAVKFDLKSGTPNVLWTKELGELIDWAAPANGANGALYFGSAAHFMALGYGSSFFAPGEAPAT